MFNVEIINQKQTTGTGFAPLVYFRDRLVFKYFFMLHKNIKINNFILLKS